MELLALGRRTLDNDEIAARLDMNRHYVNQICRKLAGEGIVERPLGRDGKYVNRISSVAATPPHHERIVAPRIRRGARERKNIEALVTDFATCVERFESSVVFPGPSLYFHARALARRSQFATAAELLDDERFLEYVYAVLPSWSVHRMGNQAAKVVDFSEMAASLRSAAPKIDRLWAQQITDVGFDKAASLGEEIWNVIASLRVSRSETRIVAGSKALHHVLPELVPPIDRQYTFRFFTGQKAVNRGDERAFREWFPLLCEIGRRCKPQIEDALERGGFMATSRSKLIDNAIIGFMQRADASGRTDPI